jgi:hypothetical protein
VLCKTGKTRAEKYDLPHNRPFGGLAKPQTAFNVPEQEFKRKTEPCSTLIAPI